MSGWEASALCAQVGAVLFFPKKGESTAPAKAICRRCEVRAECLEAALARHERYGVWGGLSERERRPLRQAREVIPR